MIWKGTEPIFNPLKANLSDNAATKVLRIPRKRPSTSPRGYGVRQGAAQTHAFHSRHKNTKQTAEVNKILELWLRDPIAATGWTAVMPTSPPSQRQVPVRQFLPSTGAAHIVLDDVGVVAVLQQRHLLLDAADLILLCEGNDLHCHHFAAVVCPGFVDGTI